MKYQDERRLQELWQQGEAGIARGDLPRARAVFEALLARVPTHAPTRMQLFTIATWQGRFRDAVAQLENIVALNSGDADLLIQLVEILQLMGESEAAIACARKLAAAPARNAKLIVELANFLIQLGQFGLARSQLDHADKLVGISANTLYLRSNIELVDGNLDESERLAEECVARAPEHYRAHGQLARLRRQTAERNHVTRLQDLLERERSPAHRATLYFALFKELDDLQRHDEAWRALSAGCVEKRALLDYRVPDEIAAFDTLHRWQPTHPAGGSKWASDGAQPIFIIGLPRTGTTLLERILGGHPDVQNAGELDDMPSQLRWCCDRFSKYHLDPDLFRAAERIDFAQLGRRYLQHTQWRACGKQRYTDKLPMNFLHVGFIAEALPQAPILHMVRDPMDSCFSNLKELFADAYPYSYRFDELAGHYGRYRRLMAHWHQRYPGRILDVSYEKLVTNPEMQALRVLQFCGLSWAPKCVEVASNQAPVSTASSVQVRENIHRERVQNWRKYADKLQPLRDRLKADGWLP